MAVLVIQLAKWHNFYEQKCFSEVLLFLGHYNRSLNLPTLDFSVRHTVEQNCLVAVEEQDLVIL